MEDQEHKYRKYINSSGQPYNSGSGSQYQTFSDINGYNISSPYDSYSNWETAYTRTMKELPPITDALSSPLGSRDEQQNSLNEYKMKLEEKYKREKSVLSNRSINTNNFEIPEDNEVLTEQRKQYYHIITEDDNDNREQYRTSNLKNNHTKY